MDFLSLGFRVVSRDSWAKQILCGVPGGRALPIRVIRAIGREVISALPRKVLEIADRSAAGQTWDRAEAAQG